MRDVVLLDINETILDLAPLRSRFHAVLGSEASVSEWFRRLLHASTVCAMTGITTSFRELAGHELDRMVSTCGTEVSPGDREEILHTFGTLPPHPDVPAALDRLRSAGRRVAALSNSSTELLQHQVEAARLATLFEKLISAEEVRSFKPDARVYHHAVQRMDREPGRVWMVAAHDWDVLGAMCAGLSGAYLARSAIPFHPAFLPPDLAADSLEALTESLLAVD